MDSPDFWSEQNIDLAWDSIKIGGTAKVLNRPYGVVMILGSSNSELDSMIKPLAGSIASGNYTIIKPNVASFEGETEKVITRILKKTLDPRRSLVLDFDFNPQELIERHEVDLLFSSKLDVTTKDLIKICGDKQVEVKLHSDGWNPAIVESTADVIDAAKHLTQNKFYKSGQTPSNLDVIYVNEAVYPEFLVEMKAALSGSYMDLKNNNLKYGKIRNTKDFDRLLAILKKSEHGGEFENSLLYNKSTMTINPILIRDPHSNSVLMKEKINGPLLPLKTYKNLSDIIPEINAHNHIGNLYLFSQNKYLLREAKRFLKYQHLYENCTNDSILLSQFPTYGKHSTMNCGVNGPYSVHTFSRQRLFLKGGFNPQLGSNIWTTLSRAKCRRFLTGTAIAYGVWKMLL